MFISKRAALIASLIAKNTDDAKNSGGSPTAYKDFSNIINFNIISLLSHFFLL